MTRHLLGGLLALLAFHRAAADEPGAAADPAQRAEATRSVRVPRGFRYEILVMGGIPEPVYLKFSPDGRLWFTGRRGNIWAWDPASGRHEEIARLDVCWEPIPGREANERGLHGLEFDPDYLRNGHLYVHYAPHVPTNATAWTNVVARFTVDRPERATRIVPDSRKVLVAIPSTRGFHQGGALEFNPVDRKLYVTTGDNNVSSDTESFHADPNNPPQVLSDLRGKTLRLNLDGSIPGDNPFVGRPDAHPAVYTYGHRNPYSMNIDPVTGNVYVGEVGYDRKEDWEEINWLRPGGNYGWPRCMGENLGTYGGDCPLPDAVAPWVTWVHDNGANATSGPFLRPRGERAFPPTWSNGMFYADWVRKWIRFARVDPDGNRVTETVPFARGFTAGIMAMQQGPDGALYLAEYGGWFTGVVADKISRIVQVPAGE